jgi:hypothetical protein
MGHAPASAVPLPEYHTLACSSKGAGCHSPTAASWIQESGAIDVDEQGRVHWRSPGALAAAGCKERSHTASYPIAEGTREMAIVRFSPKPLCFRVFRGYCAPIRQSRLGRFARKKLRTIEKTRGKDEFFGTAIKGA